jgi:hypothetical protein
MTWLKNHHLFYAVAVTMLVNVGSAVAVGQVMLQE